MQHYAVIKMKEIRDERGLSNYQVNKITGISDSTLNSYNDETMERIPELETVEKFCKGFGISMSEFFADFKFTDSPTDMERKVLIEWKLMPFMIQKLFLQLLKAIRVHISGKQSTNKEDQKNE